MGQSDQSENCAGCYQISFDGWVVDAGQHWHADKNHQAKIIFSEWYQRRKKTDKDRDEWRENFGLTPDKAVPFPLSQ
jgi:hypothetical protein